MGAIAKRLVLRHPAPAERNNGSASQAEVFAQRIGDPKIAFYPERPIVVDSNLDGHPPNGNKTRFYNAHVWSRRVSLLLMTVLAHGQYSSTAPLSPDTILLARIRYVMAENIRKLPNYTCTMEVERSRRRAKSRRYESQDLLRIEVAFVSGKELYAWPGSAQFEEREISEMIPGGAIGSGDFALHAKSIFLTTIPTFTYLGKTMLGETRVHSFEYRVPRLRSAYLLRVKPAEGIVGYHGVVYNDLETLDLLRLEIDVDEIPATVPVERARNVIEYQRLPIGGSTFLLPKSSEMIISDVTGEESRNRTSFSNCHQYSGESVLTFEEPGKDLPAAAAEPPVTIQLPSDLELYLKLTQLSSKGRMAVGDAFQAEVTKAVRRKGDELLAKGARIEGRITQFMRLSGPEGFYLIGMRPERFVYANKTGPIEAALQLPAINAFLGPGFRGRVNTVRLPDAMKKNTGYFLVASDKFVLPSGLTMVWRTLDVSGAAQQ